jgi:hypothetical protein
MTPRTDSTCSNQFLVNKNMATGDAAIKVNSGVLQIRKPSAMVIPCVPEANPVRWHPQAGQSQWIRRPLSNHLAVTEVN